MEGRERDPAAEDRANLTAAAIYDGLLSTAEETRFNALTKVANLPASLQVRIRAASTTIKWLRAMLGCHVDLFSAGVYK